MVQNEWQTSMVIYEERSLFWSRCWNASDVIAHRVSNVREAPIHSDPRHKWAVPLSMPQLLWYSGHNRLVYSPDTAFLMKAEAHNGNKWPSLPLCWNLWAPHNLPVLTDVCYLHAPKDPVKVSRTLGTFHGEKKWCENNPWNISENTLAIFM